MIILKQKKGGGKDYNSTVISEIISEHFILQENIPVWPASFTNLKPTAVKGTTQFAFRTDKENGFQETYLTITLHCTLLANHQKDL